MGDSETSFCLNSLLCLENESCFNQVEDDENKYIDYTICFDSDNEEAYVENLFKKESSFGSKGSMSSDDCDKKTQNWLKSVRLDAIEWIFNTRSTFGFRFETAYLSITYFDRFLSKGFIDEGKIWAIRLLSIACLSLAAKMEECKVPALSEFQVEAFAFESRLIQRMELLVLNTLEWEMRSITPFSYLHYFINKFYGESRPKGLIFNATKLIVALTKEIDLMGTRPSIIAAAAVLAASDGQLMQKTMDLKLSPISYWDSQDIESMNYCYNIMREVEKRNVKTPELSISTHSSMPIHTSSHDMLESTSYTSVAGTKRRLSFNDSVDTSLAKKIHHS